MGSEGYPDQPQFTAPRTNKRNGPLGRKLAKTACASPSKSCAGARVCGPRLHHRLPRLSMLDLVEGGNDWTRSWRWRKAVEAAGATIKTPASAGTKARIPTIATWCRARRSPASPPSCACTWRSAGHHQPHQHAGSGRGALAAAMPTWCRWRGPSWPIRVREQGARRRARTRSTPASPATRPASTTSSNKRASCLVNPRACHETELVIAKPRRRDAGRRGRRRAQPCELLLRDHRRRRRGPRRDAVRCRRVGGQLNLAQAPCQTGRFDELLRLFPRAARSAHRRELCNSNARRAAERQSQRLRCTAVVAAGVPRRRGISPASDHPEGRSATPTFFRVTAREASPSSAPAASASTSPLRPGSKLPPSLDLGALDGRKIWLAFAGLPGLMPQLPEPAGLVA